MSRREVITCDWCKQQNSSDIRSWYVVETRINAPRHTLAYEQQHIYVHISNDMCPECYNEWKEWAPKWNKRSPAPNVPEI